LANFTISFSSFLSFSPTSETDLQKGNGHKQLGNEQK